MSGPVARGTARLMTRGQNMIITGPVSMAPRWLREIVCDSPAICPASSGEQRSETGEPPCTHALTGMEREQRSPMAGKGRVTKPYSITRGAKVGGLTSHPWDCVGHPVSVQCPAPYVPSDIRQAISDVRVNRGGSVCLND